MSTIMKEVFKSRFGFHPVPYEIYRKLKFIHKCYYQTLHDVGTHTRWQRKTKNRKGPEPAVFWELYLPRYSNELNPWVQDYQRARMPKATEAEVPTLNHSIDEINQMYYRCKEFFGE